MTREEKIEVVLRISIEMAKQSAKDDGISFNDDDEKEIIDDFKEDSRISDLFIKIIDECVLKSQPTDIVEVINQQNTIIGKLTRESENLKDTQFRLNEWRDKQKKEAGFDSSMSFDHVWSTVLEKAKQYDELNVNKPK